MNRFLFWLNAILAVMLSIAFMVSHEYIALLVGTANAMCAAWCWETA